MRKILQFFFYHFYHAFAWTYDFVAAAVSLGRWNDWVLTALPHLHGPRVLEIGFGPGHLQVELRQKGLLAYGLDESRQMGQLALERARRFRFPATLSRGYAQSLPFGADCFDDVVATFPAEYIFDPRTVAEVHRVLKPGGRFVVVPMAWVHGNGFWDRLTAWLFHLTSQSVELSETAESQIRAHFTETGFRVNLLQAEAQRSQVLVIVAEK